MATTKTEYKLEKEDISNTSSTTVKIDMKEESSEDQLAVDEDIALVQASIMVMNENELGAQVFLMSFDGVFFTKVEGTARLYRADHIMLFLHAPCSSPACEICKIGKLYNFTKILVFYFGLNNDTHSGYYIFCR